MNRIPHAAKTLVRQVREQFPDAEIGTDEKDGFGVHRALVFTGDVAEWLRSADLAMSLDDRVDDVWIDAEGTLRVRFVADSRADVAQPEYPLSEVAAIETDDEPDEKITLDELKGTPVAELREMYPQYADLSKKEIIEAVLADL